MDGEQLWRVFDNLLENSRKYGGVTPLHIRITLERTERGFSVCFSDNGVGVAEEKLPYLFDEFYRTVYLILGMMTGSLYAIGMGPTTLKVPQAPLNIGNFSLAPAVVGVVLVFGMQRVKERSNK